MVHIIDSYYLDSDRLNLIIKKKGTSKDRKTGETKEKFIDEGYYNSVESALRSLYKKYTRKLVEKSKEQEELSDLYIKFYKLQKRFEDNINTGELETVKALMNKGEKENGKRIY